MSEQHIYNKTEECISRFKNGPERFITSHTFNLVVQELVRGADPYDIIDQLCHNMDVSEEAFKQYMYRDTRPMITGF